MSNEKRTIGEVAKLLDITPTTVRNYVHVLGSRFLSPDAVKPTGKRFTPEDVSVLRKLRSLLTEGNSYEVAIERLPVTPEIVAETEPEPEEKQPGSAIQTIEMFERFQALMQLQHEQFQETLHAKDETISTLREENERLRSENDRLKTPWWKKLFTR